MVATQCFNRIVTFQKKLIENKIKKLKSERCMLLLIFFITVFYIDKFKTNTPKTHTRKACRTRFEEFMVKCVVHSNYNNLEIRPILGKPSGSPQPSCRSARDTMVELGNLWTLFLFWGKNSFYAWSLTRTPTPRLYGVSREIILPEKLCDLFYDMQICCGKVCFFIILQNAFLLDHCIISVDNVLEKGHTVQYNNPLQSWMMTLVFPSLISSPNPG